jgi:hypothetical protein
MDKAQKPSNSPRTHHLPDTGLGRRCSENETSHLLQNTKTQTVVKLTVVPCAPVVEVKIKRPDTKYQLGFSVQNGVVGAHDKMVAFWSSCTFTRRCSRHVKEIGN